MNRFRPLALTLASILLSVITLTGLSHPALGQPQWEEQVLQIIRDHPEVIIESVQNYQQQQQEKAEAAQHAFAQKMRIQPAAVIGNAPHTGAQAHQIILLEFSDFQCPFCAQAHTTVKQFMAKHGNEVTLVYRAFPLTNIHPQALSAAQAAWAAQQQGQFWAYYDALFTQQKELGESLYGAIAQDLHLDLQQFEADRKSPAATTAIQTDIALAQDIGISGTPTFFLNGTPLSGQDLKEMEQTLEQVRS